VESLITNLNQIKSEVKSRQIQNLTNGELRDLVRKCYQQIKDNLGIKPQEVSGQEIDKAYEDRFGKGHLLLWDKKYWACSAEEYEKIARWLWQDRKQYVRDQFDCDNYAGAWKVFIYEVFGITAVGLSLGMVYDKNSDKPLGGHAYNHNYTLDKGVLLFEAETDKTSDNDTIGNWRYETSRSYWW